MDALDIFRKLTKGLTFKSKAIGKNKQEQKNNIESHIINDVVEEPFSDEDIIFEDKQPEPEAVAENDENYEFNMMSNFQVTESGVKKSKKKKQKLKKITEKKKSAIELEEARRFRSEHGIKVIGLDPSAPLKDFASLTDKYEVSQQLVDNLTQCGYVEPTPIQRQAITSMLEHRQILACAPTGSGKTAAFVIPLLQELKAPQRGPRALILCPTRELSKQIYREALRLSAGTNLIINFVPKITQDKIESKKKLLQKTDLLISTPNRLCYLLDHENSPLSLAKVKWLVIDEADKLFEGSEDNEANFRPQLEKILKECFMEASLSLFSATQTPILHEWCKRNMDQLLCITIGQKNAATELVEQELLYVGNEYGKLVAFRQLVQKGLKPPVLVFVQSKDRAKQLFKELIYDGINVDVIHADRTQLQRDNVVRSFRVGKIWVLICTELMGRGIDFRGVSLVINYDFPPSSISYVHRIGRAGRAGQKGKAVTFFTQDDIPNLKSIVKIMKQSGCEVPEYMLTLKQTRKNRKQMLKYAPKREDISTELPDRETIKRRLREDREPEKPKRRKLNDGSSENAGNIKGKEKYANKNNSQKNNKKHHNEKMNNHQKHRPNKK